jgi:hypothetical protein
MNKLKFIKKKNKHIFFVDILRNQYIISTIFFKKSVFIGLINTW